jgi:hypothetical protein
MRPANDLMTELHDGARVSEDEWRAAYVLAPERDAAFTTLSGEPIRPLYTA